MSGSKERIAGSKRREKQVNGTTNKKSDKSKIWNILKDIGNKSSFFNKSIIFGGGGKRRGKKRRFKRYQDLNQFIDIVWTLNQMKQPQKVILGMVEEIQIWIILDDVEELLLISSDEMLVLWLYAKMSSHFRNA